jgi:hypothetical protein
MRIQRIGMFPAAFLLLLLALGTPTTTDAKTGWDYSFRAKVGRK